MGIEMIEKMINEALDKNEEKKTNFKYDLTIGDYPIKITMGVN